MSIFAEVLKALGANYGYVLAGMLSVAFVTTAYFAKQSLGIASFAYATTRVRVMASRMLKQNKLRELADSYCASDVIAAFEGSAYEQHVAGKHNLEDIEQGLAMSLAEDYQKIRAMCPKRASALFDFMSARYDLENIKKIFASKITGEPIKALMPSTMSEAFLQKLIDAETTEDMLKLLERTRYKTLIASVSDTSSIRAFENAIERYLRDELYGKSNIELIAKKAGILKDSVYLKEIFGIQNDIFNIKIALRLISEGIAEKELQRFLVKGGFYLSKKNLYALAEAKDMQAAINALQDTPYHQIMSDAMRLYSQEKSLYVFECALDSFYMKTIRSIAFRQPFGLTPIVCYLLQKEQEIATIRAILNAIKEGIPKEKIMNIFVGA